MQKRIYLDYNATAPVLPEVVKKVTQVLTHNWANPSSTHTNGRKAKLELEESREAIAASIGVPARELHLTSGGTEAANLAVIGTCIPKGPGHIICSAIEHPAVMEAMERLQNIGWELDLIPAGSDGVIDLGVLKSLLREDTQLVSVMYANNETGVLQPITEIAALLKESKTLFHSDAVQAWGKVNLHVKGLDLLSISSHKIGGPKGAGALWASASIDIQKQQLGGPQERENRGGTEPMPMVIGMAEAARSLNIQTNTEVLIPLKKYFEKELKKYFDVIIIGERVKRVPNTTNVLFKGCKQDMLLMGLDIQGVDASAGSACAAGSIKYSKIIFNMGFSKEEASSTIRFSYGISTTQADLAKVVNILKNLVPLQPI
jgi:cysteine desulfurase